MPKALTRSNTSVIRRQPVAAQRRRSSSETARQHKKSSAHPVLLFFKWIIYQAITQPITYALGWGTIAFAWTAHGVKTIIQRWPLAALGGVIGMGLAVAIIINAVTLQVGEHPSPMFVNGKLQAPITPVAKPRDLPPSRPQQIVEASPTTDSARTVTIPAQSPETAEDPIARLIIESEPPSTVAQPVSNHIQQVQKALAKLGYAITPDGRNGPATQKAITAFEQLEALPLTGDPNNIAMRKALSVASGLAL